MKRILILYIILTIVTISTLSYIMGDNYGYRNGASDTIDYYNCYEKQNLTFNYSQDFKYTESTLSLTSGNLTSGNLNRSSDLIFHGNKVIFKDGNLSISWTEEGVLGILNLSSFNRLEFNIGNKTHTFINVEN